MKIIIFPAFFALVMSSTSCSPSLYFIDRHTVMEEEAAGEWLDLEQELLQNSKRPGATPLEKSTDQKKRQRVLSVLSGEFNNSSK